MIHLYQSNALEALGHILTQNIKHNPLQHVFEPEVVVSQSLGMNRWISLTMVENMNIFAHVDFRLPASLAWHLIQKANPNISRFSPFAPSMLRWNILAYLKDVQNLQLTHQDDAINSLKDHEHLFDLAEVIADTLDQYLVFRPDWIQTWEKNLLQDLGKDEKWQAKLWQSIRKEILGPHRIALIESIDHLSTQELPQRIHFFGISHLPPLYLNMLTSLGKKIDVYVYALNPCAEYWEDSYTTKHITDLNFLVDEHPLLLSSGQQGRVFFKSITSVITEENSHSLFISRDNQSTILHQIQHDILLRKTPEFFETDEQDSSIIISAHHNIRRELEGLRDHILDSMHHDPHLNPDEIMVMTPNINIYAPYIDAVFQKQKYVPYIPYSIADYSEIIIHPILDAITQLLRLVHSRLYKDEIFKLLRTGRFEFSIQEIDLLEQWSINACIFWGMNDEHVASYNAAIPASHTWEAGFHRLLLGQWAYPSEGLSIHPNPSVGTLCSEQHELLIRWYTWMEKLWDTLQVWKKATTLQEWQKRIQNIANEWIVFQENSTQQDQKAFELIFERLYAWQIEAEISNTRNLHISSRDIYQDWLHAESFKDHHRFLAGGLSFCGMVPMRSIPFKKICLLGMNHDAYPRENQAVSFDLISQHPRQGDRSRHQDDRYLFLESIISAQESLYLSYIAYKDHGTERIPPSILVQELIDVLMIMNPTFSIQENARHSFSEQLTYQKSFDQKPYFQTRDEKSVKINIQAENWALFWKDPIQFFLQKNAHAQLSKNVQDTVYEPMSMPYHKNLWEILQHPEKTILKEKRAGRLPSHLLGDLYEKYIVNQFNDLAKIIKYDECQEKKVVVDEFEEWFMFHPDYGQIVLLYHENDWKTLWTAWRRHLMLQHQHPEKSTLIDIKSSKIYTVWLPMDRDLANNLFNEWIHAYHYGHKCLFPWIPECWGDYIKHGYDKMLERWKNISHRYKYRLLWDEIPEDFMIWVEKLVTPYQLITKTIKKPTKTKKQDQ